MHSPGFAALNRVCDTNVDRNEKETIMGGAGMIIFIAAFIVLGLSIWGLFNKGRSILCALAGIMVTLGAAMGAMYAWGESRSIPWTVAYLIAALIGFVCVLRQVKRRKPEPQPGGTEPAATDG
ncbi:MAG: hypothetical protein HN742_17295 [Lentisphaerae bacterium]|jgi:hypothetical protein|nr:hypothetical protein [Lentisphaerota bacterium]MBT5605657.1 hypothetical protein [Lentisphaerota bacterium]MBT7056324.1 hypothetical protein [Lentisphaerota bacterium]MBT7843637.1 hypothetical protein [Lentisphaerota bacterium]